MLARMGKLRHNLKEFGARYRIAIFSTALICFIAGLVFTGKSLSLSVENLVLLPLLIIVFVTQPLLILFNSLELKLCGHAVSVDVSLYDSVYIGSSASLANILPLPAGLLVRGGALVQRGGKIGAVSKILLVAGVLWMAVAMTVSGAVISEPSISLLVTVLGAAMVLALMLYVSVISSPKIAFGFLIIRLVMVAIFALQLKLCFAALGEVISFRGSAVYVVSGLAGAVVSVVPAGLGLTEAFGALLAKLDGASPALAYIVLSLNRLIGFATVGLTFFFFANKKSSIGRKVSYEEIDG